MPRGGAKPGERRGGRKRGTPNKATGVLKQSLEEMCRAHAELAVATLVRLATSAESEMAQASAANSLLDRGYGKPKQAVSLGNEGDDPLVIKIVRLGDA